MAIRSWGSDRNGLGEAWGFEIYDSGSGTRLRAIPCLPTRLIHDLFPLNCERTPLPSSCFLNPIRILTVDAE